MLLDGILVARDIHDAGLGLVFALHVGVQQHLGTLVPQCNAIRIVGRHIHDRDDVAFDLMPCIVAYGCMNLIRRHRDSRLTLSGDLNG